MPTDLTMKAALVLMWLVSGTGALAQDSIPLSEGDPSWWVDGPPKMGTISGEGDGDRIVWTTYDFSIGAFDASAWVTKDNDGTGPQRLSVLGYTDPDSFDGRILFRVNVTGYTTGTFAAEVSLIDEDIDAPRQTGLITFEISRFDRDDPDASYGNLAATAQGTICSTANTIDCFEATFVIETQIQFGS